ncbi:MAG: putative esterase/lipase, partial [Dehalococcoidia bacterium]|nr:putative esterase/lipase [Dehalococcoidia bacterium]
LSREDYYRTLLPWIYTEQEFQGAISYEDAVRRLAADPQFQEPEAYDRQVHAALHFSSRKRLGSVSCPTLLIFGEDDLLTPMRFARSLSSGIPRSRLVVLAGAGHGLLRTRPTEVGSLVHGFLSESP